MSSENTRSDFRHPDRPPTSYTDYRYLGRRMLQGVEFDDASRGFLHQFALHRDGSFFKYRPPHWINVNEQAFLAGAAECLSIGSR